MAARIQTNEEMDWGAIQSQEVRIMSFVSFRREMKH
jgi:hypothetical protein